jgi:hypothetical protein
MSPRHAAPVTRRQAITAFIVLVLAAGGWGIWQSVASDVAKTWWGPRVTYLGIPTGSCYGR